MSFLDTFKKQTDDKSKTGNSFLDSFNQSQQNKPKDFTEPKVDTGFIDKVFTGPKITDTPFFKETKRAGQELSGAIRKPLESIVNPILQQKPIEKIKDFFSIPIVQDTVNEISKRTSGTGIAALMKSTYEGGTFDEAYNALREAQANNPSRLARFINQLADSAPQTALGVALASTPFGAGKVLAPAYWTALSADEQIQQYGKVKSVANIGIDVLGDQVLGASIESLLKSPTKTFVKTVSDAFIAEGGTEVAQDLLKYNQSYAEAETPEERRAIVDDVKNYFKSGQILMTLGVGGISGAGVGATSYAANQLVNDYQKMTPGQKQGGYLSIKGLDTSNPIDTLQEIADTHLNEMDNVLSDPNLTAEDLTAMGGEKAVIERAKINLSDGLDKINKTSVANDIRNIPITDKTTTADFRKAALNIIKEASPVIESDNLTVQIPIRDTKEDEKIAQDIINRRSDLDNLIADKNQLEKQGAPADTINRLQNNIDQLQAQFNEPSANDNIIQEAKKYKTVEEFINKQTIYYHGTDNKIDGNLKPSSDESASFGKGIYLTLDKNIAKDYGKNVIEVLPTRNLKLKNITDEQRTDIVDLFGQEQTNYIKDIIGTEYDGIIVPAKYGDGEQIVIYNTDILKTKPQLIDIWKKANSQAPSNIIVAKTPSGEVDKIVDKPTQTLLYDAGGPVIPTYGGTVASPGNARYYNKLRERFAEGWTKMIERFQNSNIRVEQWVKSKGDSITPENDPTVSQILYPGRLKSSVNKVIDTASKIDKDLVNTAKKLKLDDQVLQKQVNDYLIAKHAPERNAKLQNEKAAGITTEEAEAKLKDIEALPHFKEIERLAKNIKDMNWQVLEILHANGNPWALIDTETYNLLRNTYKEHVPLNRIFEETTDEDIGQVLSGRGIDVRGSGLKRARGSEREVSDILTNVTSNLVQAITRAEKNFIAYQFYSMVEENPDAIGTTRSGTPVGKTFDGKIIFKPENGENVLPVMVDGKQKYIEFTNPAFAQAVRGVNIEHMPALLKWIGAYGRLLSQLVTKLSPEFLLTNPFRDKQEALVFSASQPKIGGLKNLSKQVFRNLKLEGERDIKNYRLGKETEGSKIYQQMLEDGGASGGFGMITKKDLEINIDKIRKLNRSKPRQAANMILKSIDIAGEIMENSTRLIIYKQALEAGLSRREAAVLAKESTVNFDRKGTAGPIVNSLYMFSNASIQGIAKNLKALKNPKTLFTTTAVLLGLVSAIGKHNDDLDPDWEDKISEFEKAGALTILLNFKTSKGEYYRLVWPIAYGIRPLKVFSNEVYHSITGKSTGLKDSFQKLVSAVIDGYNPLSGTDLVSTITPTLADLPVDVLRNKKWTGSKIYPDYNENLSDSRKYYDSLGDSPIGKAFITATKFLSDKNIVEISPEVLDYTLENLAGGLGQFTKRTGNFVTNIFTGEQTNMSNVPFVGKFLKQTDPDALDKYSKNQQVKMIKEIKNESANKSFDVTQEAKDVIKGLKGKDVKDIQSTLNELKFSNPKLYQEVIDNAKTARLSQLEKQIKSLNVSDGVRALFVVSQLDKIQDPAKKAEFLKNLVDKKIITAKVKQQILQLKGRRDNSQPQ